MKNRTLVLTLSLLSVCLFSCSTAVDNVILDNNNAANSIGSFVNTDEIESLVFDPTEVTQQPITIGVSTSSTTDRTIQFSIDETITTLDQSLISITPENPVIPAGEFTTDIMITIDALGQTVLPEAGTQVGITLDGIDDVSTLSATGTSLALNVVVNCEVDFDLLTEDTQVSVLRNQWADVSTFTPEPITVVRGPEPNQITIVNGVGTPSSSDIILNVDPETGSLSSAQELGTFNFEVTIFSFFGLDFEIPRPVLSVEGQLTSCIGLIELELGSTLNPPNSIIEFNISVPVDF